MNRRVLALALLAALPASLPAQTGSARAELSRAIAAYQNLDFDVAATLLRRALSGELSDSARIQALTYLGAAEHYRAQHDSAAAAFRQLVVLAPGYQPDTLVFPPEVMTLYNDVRARTSETPPVALTMKDTVSHAPPPATAPPPPPPPAQTASSSREGVQDGITATGGGTLVHVRAQSEAGGLPPASGMVLGMTASVRYRRFDVGLRYLQGSLDTRDLVEGAVALRYVTTPWLAIHTGPQIRRYETPGGAERWVTWQLGARAEAPLAGPSLRGHALLWGGRVLSVNVPPGSGTARGGEVGLTLDVASRPFWFALAYGIDQASVQGSSRREKVGALTLTAGLRRLP